MSEKTEIFVANKSFATQLDGAPQVINKGERVLSPHELLDRHPDNFDPVDEAVTYGNERATDDPGEGRQRQKANEGKSENTGESIEESLKGLKREELDAKATELGVEKPEELQNVDAVKKAIIDASAAAQG